MAKVKYGLVQRILIATILFPNFFIGMAKSANSELYHLQNITPLSDGGTGWDHISIDAANRHVFAGRGPKGLSVIDADTGLWIGFIDETQGSHGATIAEDLGLGFSDNGKGGDLTIFDLKTLKVQKHITVGETTDGVFYDTVTQTGIVNNGETGHITFFNPQTGNLLGDIDLQTKKPEFGTVDGKGNFYIDLQDQNAIARVDINQRKITAVWKIDICEQPSSLAYDATQDRLIVGCRGASPVGAIVDAKTGKTIATLPIGLGNDWAGFDQKSGLAFFSNGGSGTLTIIQQSAPDHYSELETVGTRPLARTATFDPLSRAIILLAARYVRLPSSDDGKPAKTKIEPDSSEILFVKPSRSN